MTVVIDINKRELEILNTALGTSFDINNPDEIDSDDADAIHTLIGIV